MSTIHCSLFGALLISGLAAAQTTVPQLTPVDAPAPIHAGTYYAATGQFVPFDPNAAQVDLPADVVYNNNHYTGWFYDINDGTLIVDEGRLPSTTSPTSAVPVSLTGTSDSYRITGMQIAYVTDSIGDCAARVAIFNNYATCSALTSLPVVDLVVTGLPGTIQPGGLTPYTFDIDLTGLEFCMLADGDGVYDNVVDDRFGYAFLMSGDVGSQTGPIVGALPGPFAPEGDGTAFQNPGAPSGTGLDTEDQWYDVDPVNGINCYNHGGYNPLTGNPAFGSYWLVLEADLSYNCSSCQNGVDDGFEDNDDCLSAAMLAAPSTNPGLTAYGGDPDYYRVTVPPNTVLNVLAIFDGGQADLDMELFNADCTTQYDYSGSGTSNEDVSYFNCGLVPEDVTIFIYEWPLATASGCGDYDLELTLDSSCPADDLLEDNDDCSQGFPVSLGLTPNLRISTCDEDYFSITLDPGESMNAAIFFLHAEMDLDLYLYPAGAATCGDRTGNEFLTRSWTTTNDEFIGWTNNTGQVQDYIIKVEVWGPESEVCAGYSLSYLEGGGPGVGTNFCTAELNSTGRGAHIFATGSDILSMNNLVLNCEFLPAASSGYFITSQTQIFIPQAGGSVGNLCISGPNLGRYNQPLQVQNTGAGSTVALATDNQMIPQATVLGFTTATIGDTWNFQYWYRDLNMTVIGSNFSDALSVTFQ